MMVAGCMAVSAYAAKFEAISRPSKDITLSFTRPGRIAEMFVSVGDRVSAGEPLAKLDDRVEQVQLAQLKAQAEDTIRIEAAKAKLDQSKVDLDKIESAWSPDAEHRAVTEFELDHARLDVEISRLSLTLAEFEHSQDQRKYTEAGLSVEQMSLHSPIDGTVEVLFVEQGESVDALQKVIHIVDVDPLWIDVPVSIDIALGLSVGDSAQVLFGNQQTDGKMGKIIYIASVGDAASNTLRVRVELANPTGRPAGEQVSVSFLTGFQSVDDSDGDAEQAGQADESDRADVQDEPKRASPDGDHAPGPTEAADNSN